MRKFGSRVSLEIAIAVLLTIAAVIILIIGFSSATGQQKGELSVSNAWARPTVGKQATGVIYLTIENRGAVADTLTGVRTKVAATAMLHKTLKEGGVMRMRHVHGGIAVAPGSTVKLEPAGLHIMLMEVTAPLKKGQSFPATLIFEKSGEIEVAVTVNIVPPDQADERGSHTQ
jgi:copper(I)-binding protein